MDEWRKISEVTDYEGGPHPRAACGVESVSYTLYRNVEDGRVKVVFRGACELWDDELNTEMYPTREVELPETPAVA